MHRGYQIWVRHRDYFQCNLFKTGHLIPDNNSYCVAQAPAQTIGSVRNHSRAIENTGGAMPTTLPSGILLKHAWTSAPIWQIIILTTPWKASITWSSPFPPEPMWMTLSSAWSTHKNKLTPACEFVFISWIFVRSNAIRRARPLVFPTLLRR